MLTKWNELTWPGAGAHNGCGKTQQTGKGGSGAAHLRIRGAYTKHWVRFFQRCREGKGAMVKSFSEGNLDQRYGKKNMHTSKNLPIHGDLLVLSKQYDPALEGRLL